MKRRERGVMSFLQRPSDFRLMTPQFRTLWEQGRIAEAMQPVNDTLELMGYGCCEEYKFQNQDITKEWKRNGQTEKEERWLRQTIEFINRNTLMLAESVANYYGMKYLQEKYCPVCWARPNCVSVKELAEKAAFIVSESCCHSIQLYHLAVTDESRRLYDISMPVVWMRYSFLRRFKVGQDLINVYRMMRNSMRIYDIPPFPHRGVPDCLL